MDTMSSSWRVVESLLRRGLPGAALLAGCATAASEQSAHKPSGVTRAEAYERLLMREYPKELLDAGIGGVTTLEFVVGEDGVVREVGVRESSGHAALDEAALRLAPLVPFTRPVGHNRQPIAAKITFPVSFDPDAAMAADTCGKIKPSYINKHEMERVLVREYPALLRDRGIGGKTIVWFLIDEEGRVPKQQVHTSSGYRELDEAALRSASAARFSPAIRCGKPVPVWIALPISFRSHVRPEPRSEGPMPRSGKPVD